MNVTRRAISDPDYFHGAALAAQAMAVVAARLAVPDPELIQHEMLTSLERLRVGILPSEAGDAMLLAIDHAEGLVRQLLELLRRMTWSNARAPALQRFRLAAWRAASAEPGTGESRHAAS
jgi:hypothetical protein